MSDEPKTPGDDDEYQPGSLGRMRSIAKIIFGLLGILGLVKIVVGLCVVAYGMITGH
jgi:hypothetical protein